MTKLQRFIPQTPDPFLRQADQLGAVKFGHLNALVDAINATVYGDYLQLQGNGPMSTTLRALEDPVGNIAHLYLATDKTAISSSLKIGNITPNLDSAILQIDSTTKGVLFPRMTVAERDAIASPAVGLLIFNTDTNQINAWNGSAWVPGGFLHLDELYSDAVQQTVGVTPKSTYTNANLALVPNGTGAITAQVPDDTATGGNARGAYSVDLQRVRTSADQVAYGTFGFIGSGKDNKIQANADYVVINGGQENTAGRDYATIGGGLRNSISAFTSGSRGTIGGGETNVVSSDYSTISGGQSNTASTNTHATVVGGSGNTSSGQFSVSGGQNNTASGLQSVAFGNLNTASGNYSTVFGDNNNVSAYWAFVGGRVHTVNGWYSSVLGSGHNVSSQFASVLGRDNVVSSTYATVSGGQNNTVSTNSHATVIGGYLNLSSGEYSVSGGYSSEATGQAAIGIGRHAHARNSWAVVFGNNNTVNNLGSSILGGDNNNISSNFSVVSGGQSNTASTGTHATVVGGQSNTSSGKYSVSGGNNSTASGLLAIALGNSTASGTASVALGGGNSNVASNSFTLSTGNYVEAYLYGQKAHGIRLGSTGNATQSQISEIIATKNTTLDSAATTVLSLDGTGTTNLIIPNGNNRVWNVTVEYVAVCTAQGSGTTVVGDVVTGTDKFRFKRVGGTSSIGAVTNIELSQDATMTASICTYAVGGSQDLQITYVAPTTANATTFRVVAKVSLVEVAW